jgi:hypothetical protein
MRQLCRENRQWEQLPIDVKNGPAGAANGMVMVLRGAVNT